MFCANFDQNLQTLSIHIQEDNKNISSTLYDQNRKISSFTTSYNESLKKMSSRNKVITKIETVKTELESPMNTKLDELRT